MPASKLVAAFGAALLSASACVVSIPAGTDDEKSKACVYADVVLADGPLAYFRLDETGPGPVPIDAVTGAPHGAFEGAIEHEIHGVSGLAARFQLGTGNDTNGRLVLGDELDFAGTSPFSFEAWLQPELLDDKSRTIASKTGDPANSGYLLFLHNPASELIQVYRYEGVGDGTNKAGQPVTLPPDFSKRLLHVVVTYDGEKLCLHLDGVADCTPAPGACADNAANFSIGRAGPGFVGVIDEIAVYDYALSNVQISEHLNCGLGG